MPAQPQPPYADAAPAGNPPTVARPGGEYVAFEHLPAHIAEIFGEALECYRHGLWRAFMAMARETAVAIARDLGEGQRLRLYDLVGEVQHIGNIDEGAFRVIRAVVLDRDDPGRLRCDRWIAAVLLETLKDLLTQIYIRPARLRQALRVRQLFAQPERSEPAA